MIPFHFQALPLSSKYEHSVVVPVGISSKAELFAFLARALPLPDYFGHNWDALEECLGDLESEAALIHQDVPLEGHPPEQRTYLEILAGAAQNSDRFQVIFPEQYRVQVTLLLS